MNLGKANNRYFRFLSALALFATVMPGTSVADYEVATQKNIVTPKLGSYTLAKRGQDLRIRGAKICLGFFGCGYILNPLPTEFDTSSREVVGLEYERQTNKGFSYGADIFHIRNSFTVPSLNPSEGEITANFIFATMKKYFGDPRGLRPFIAGGIGFVDADLSGSVSRSTKHGAAAQTVTGVRYQSKRFGVVAEYRYVYAPSVELEDGGDVSGELSLSGHGYFLGLGVHF